ncbi:MAG: prolyl oligopeptidase family serine peptidase [Alphaproteobacteria bacterium]|nr:prolyl oligopeptidase family serine peptidase [Alphaproteobacteria bacterium]
MNAFDKRIDDLADNLRVVKPDGPGPFPVVLQFHGCGGVKPLQARYADAARAAGWAAVIVDSYAHRRISQAQAYAFVCTGLRLHGRERAGDLYAALAWARRQDWANPERLAVAGWSHGGWTVLDALAMEHAHAERATKLPLPHAPLAGVRGAFVVYPYCGPGRAPMRRVLDPPIAMTAIVGGRDSVVGTPRRALERLAAHGVALDLHLFETATHAFDEAEARDVRVCYDAALTARATALYQALLRACAA